MEKGNLTVEKQVKNLVKQDVTIAETAATFVRDEQVENRVTATLKIGNTTYQVIYDISKEVFLQNGIIYGDGSAEQDAILAEVRAAAQDLIDWEEEVAE